MSLYEKEVIDSRESDERGEGDGELSTERFECVEGDDASEARSTSSSCIVMTFKGKERAWKDNLSLYYGCRIVVLFNGSWRATKCR